MIKLIELKNVSLKSATETRLEDINITINIGDHIGINYNKLPEPLYTLVIITMNPSFNYHFK